MSQVNKPKQANNAFSAASQQDELRNSDCGSSCFTDNRDSTRIAPISDNRSPVQRITSIDHRTADFDYGTGTDKVGTVMEAFLDPLDPVQGSATGTPQKDLYDSVKAAATASMVRGHLLNHDLGGYGVAENLYPITSSANSKHKNYVENPVQKELKRAYEYSRSGGRHGNDSGQGVYYKVTVGNLKTNTDALVNNKVAFECEAKKLTGVGNGRVGDKSGDMFETTIESDAKGTRSDIRGRAFKTNTGGVPDMKDSQKIITPGWNHFARSGEKDFLDQVGDKITVGEQAGNQSADLTQDVENGVNSVLEETYLAYEEYETVFNEKIHGYSALSVPNLIYVSMMLIATKYSRLTGMVAALNNDQSNLVNDLVALKAYAEELRDELYDVTEYLFYSARQIQ